MSQLLVGIAKSEIKMFYVKNENLVAAGEFRQMIEVLEALAIVDLQRVDRHPVFASCI